MISNLRKNIDIVVECTGNKEMLKRHVNYTNSSKAKLIMDNLDNELKKFVKVLPVDFKKVLLSKEDNFKEKSKDQNLWQK